MCQWKCIKKNKRCSKLFQAAALEEEIQIFGFAYFNFIPAACYLIFSHFNIHGIPKPLQLYNLIPPKLP